MARAETTIMYGNSGTSKTSQCVYLAKRTYKRTGKRTRLISFDDGGWKPVQDEGLIEMGIVEPYLVVGKANILAHTRKLARGMWPTLVNGQRELVQTDNNEWRNIGAYYIEGLSSISDSLMRHIGDQELKVGAEDPNVRYEEDGEIFGGNSRTHYRMIQNELHKLVSLFGSLPVNHVYWTALVGRGKDLQKDPVYGPDVAGQAITGDVPSWYGECFHFQEFFTTEEIDGISVERKNVVAFFENHKDASTGVPYLAKPRTTPSQMSELLKAFPGGYVPLTYERGIEPYYDVVDKLSKNAKTSLEKWKEEIDARRKEVLGKNVSNNIDK